MNKEKNKMEKMAERILSHTLEIIYLLTGEVSLLRHLTNSLIIDAINQDKKMSDRILDHTLEIIYLLTGEEYTIVKKDSPHSHHLTGEPDGDGYKEMMNKNHQTLRTHRSSGLKVENVDTVSEERKEKRDGEDILQVTIHSDPCSEPSKVVRLKKEEESNMSVKEEEIPVNITEAHYNENAYNGSINADGEYEREEKDIQGELHSDRYTDAFMGIDTPGQHLDSQSIRCFVTGHLDDNENYQGSSVKMFLKGFNSPGEANFTKTYLSTSRDNKNRKQVSIHPKYPSKVPIKTVDGRKNLLASKTNCSEYGEISSSNNSQLPTQHGTLTGEKPFACSDCGKCFTYRSKLVKHQKWHTKEKSLACSQCGKCFIYSSHLERHLKSHIEVKPFSCSECGKCFTQKCHLVRHKLNHTGVKPFACTVCRKCFSRRSLLALHEKIHTGERPFVCSECGKGFTQKSNHDIHKRIHTRVKVIACSEADTVM